MNRVDKMAVIGGGSSYTPELIDGLIQRQAEIEVGEVALHDIAEGRLQVVGQMARRMLHHREVDTRVTTTTDRREAIDGASFVFSSIRVGWMAARIRDERIPLRYGILGQETTGPGGTLKAWRTIPVALSIAEDIHRHAPDAWYLNFTNPSGIITEAILKHSPVKVVGLCNNPLVTRAAWAQACAVPEEDIFLEWMGMNHVNWIRRIFARGADVSGELMARLENLPDIPNIQFHEPALVRTLGVFPNYYLRYYYHHGDILREALASAQTRGEVALEIEAKLLDKYSRSGQLDLPAELSERGGARYSEAALRLVSSLLSDRRDIQILVTENAGSISDLPPTASVEVPCVVSAQGPRPLVMGPMPDSVAALAHQVKSWESLTVEAGVTGDRDVALQAMLANPLVPDYETAMGLLEEMLEANREYLPQFFPEQ